MEGLRLRVAPPRPLVEGLATRLAKGHDSRVCFVDLADRLHEPDARALLMDAFGSRDAARRAGDRFASGEWAVLGFEQDGTLVGFIGLERVSAQSTRIRGISVAEARRGEGIGRLLVQEAARRSRGATLRAETDVDAVGFYVRCGFEVSALGEKYPGRERFACTLKA